MRFYQDIAHSLCVSARGTVAGQTPESLRAYSFSIDVDKLEILLRAHFGLVPSEGDLKDISCAETEVIAEFPGLFSQISTDVEIMPVGQPLSCLPGGIAYRRAGEPGTVCS